MSSYTIYPWDEEQKANQQRKPYLRSPTPQRNGVQPWDRRQVFRSVCKSRAEDKCPGKGAGRRFTALWIVRELGCPRRSVTLQVRNEPATWKKARVERCCPNRSATLQVRDEPATRKDGEGKAACPPRSGTLRVRDEPATWKNGEGGTPE